MVLIALVSLAARLDTRSRGAVGDLDDARLTIELEEDADLALLVRVADRLQANDERLAALDLDGDVLAGAHAVEIDRRRQHGNRPVLAHGPGELREDLRIHEVGRELVLADRLADLARSLGAGRF